MAEKKVTVMVIKVDLSCEKCHKKIKEVLCKIPQIQNQIYDEKANTITITVVCCSPEKITKKICCQGGDSIKGIEIKLPEKTKTKKKQEESGETEKLEKAIEPEKTKPPTSAPLLVRRCCTEWYQGYDGGPCYHGSERPPPPAPPPPAPPPPAQTTTPKDKATYPPLVRTCCTDCYQGFGRGPCYSRNERPTPCYEAYGRPVYDSCGSSDSDGGNFNNCRRGCNVGRFDCLSEENPSACSLM
ncbi:protein PYRICULARIA ORYZAE RESISTANCE 21 isoform X2 [Hevea brasiliensis]|uniref:protein PYRICULARIA ORYZAE RESISTANCE 21 isoform X2 n=1 Tax=Hevea brasiliensis TaxID=3981 RepID=UPI0025E94917|nr:protein PYRICULARIA ORYZAE RESISTANCE 21 isoform X2 [Hevea brasiliensis]